MPSVREITDYFEEKVPSALKMGFDNVGLLVGFPETQVERVLVALDITDEVVAEAREISAQLIISHHPLYFELKSFTDIDEKGRIINNLVLKGISALCLHTNLDAVRGGVNDELAEVLRIRTTGILEASEGFPDCGIGRFGELEKPLEFSEYLAFVKEALFCRGLRYYDAGRPVSKVALCGGSGGGYVERAAALGCDTLVTADIKYHQFLSAAALGINLIDAGHFETESVALPVIARILGEGFSQVDIILSNTESPIVFGS